ncbi:MAG: hypothetical protein JST27_02785 [Bacteroidetes bacterium]|nr:hypothetical protein [Bacteroidota bacterium]
MIKVIIIWFLKKILILLFLIPNFRIGGCFYPDDPGWGWGDSYDSTNHTWVDGEFYDESQVSVIPGGILRLTAIRLDQLAQIQSSWYHAEFLKGNRNTPDRWCRYKSGMIQLRRDVSGAPFEGCNDFKGFTYGMFEVRMKIPKGVTYPAFW